jgi:hypothetical protein
MVQARQRRVWKGCISVRRRSSRIISVWRTPPTLQSMTILASIALSYAVSQGIAIPRPMLENNGLR